MVLLPVKALRPCNYFGCAELIREGRYCEKHAKQTQRQMDDRRGSSAARGYNGQWQRVRMLHLKRQPLCQRCYQQGIIRPADLVHHIQSISKGGARLDTSNLMSCCTACHDAIHREQGDKW